MKDFLQKGKASFVLGGQYGSEGKGAAAAWIAHQLSFDAAGRELKDPPRFGVVTTNAGCQSGHTSVHQGVKRVAYHLPTAPLIAPGSVIYLNAGAVIRPDVLMKEIRDNLDVLAGSLLLIHPMAAVVTDDCVEAEMQLNSQQTKIASTRKGVGEALACKVLRKGVVAKDCDVLKPFIRRIDLNSRLATGQSVLVEVPQGHSLSLQASRFYPHVTSRDCTVGQACSDAGIHPSFVGPSMVVLRTYPIRVGSLQSGAENGYPCKVCGKHEGGCKCGNSGDCYPDQQETTWEALGVAPEITTVTGRVRRVFTWSQQQVIDAFLSARPTHVFLTHCDYLQGPGDLDTKVAQIYAAAHAIHLKRPKVIWSDGPSTAGAREYVDVKEAVVAK